MKNKVKLLLGLFLAFGILLNTTTITYAQNDDTIVLTHEMLGDNNTTKEVRLTKRVVDIEDGAFSGLTALQKITVDKDNEYFASYAGCLYNKDYTVLICVPQNMKTAKVYASITGYWSHALDGLEQSRKDKLDKFLGNSTSTTVSQSQTTNSYVPPTTTTPNVDKVDNHVDNSSQSTVPKTQTTDFSQYVYTDSEGYVCFKYTGSGDTNIIIPEGVERIVGFCNNNWSDRNYDITYVYLPSTIKNMYTMAEKISNDTWEFYNVLYQLPNLQTVEGGNISYSCKGSSVIRPGNITVWSSSAKYAYDPSAYTNYNNK